MDEQDNCVCGCPQDDHGHDDQYPGSTACSGCTDCIAFEADSGYEESEYDEDSDDVGYEDEDE